MGGLSRSWHGSGMGLAWVLTCNFSGMGTHAKMGRPKSTPKTGH